MLLFGGDFLSITPVVFIWAMVLQKFPVMFLFRPCAQSSSIEYKFYLVPFRAKYRFNINHLQPEVFHSLVSYLSVHFLACFTILHRTGSFQNLQRHSSGKGHFQKAIVLGSNLLLAVLKLSAQDY